MTTLRQPEGTSTNTWENVPRPFALIPTVSRQIAHEARTVPVVACAASRVVNSREAPGGRTLGEASADVPVCSFFVVRVIAQNGLIGYWRKVR